MSPAEPWKIADVIDFEHFLAADHGANDAQLRARDRTILTEPVPTDRRTLFRAWLLARRRATTGALPGASFTAGWQTLLTLAALFGGGIGISLTAGLLHYKGDEPVNVAWFFAATVGVQLFILATVLALWLVRKTTQVFADFHPLRWLLTSLAWSLSAGLRRLPGAERDQFRATLATLEHRREIYGSLTLWPLLAVTQLFGVCFNLGVLATLLLQVALSDVAFGWQSTLQASPEDAFRVVSLVAAPWSPAPRAHPTFAQIVGSQFTYSAGIARLSPEAMKSWWPFLCYAVVVYGLLVRGALLVWSATKLRTALGALAFDQQACNALFRRLTGPVIAAQGETTGLAIPQSAAPQRPAPGGACLALVANDLTLSEATLAAYLQASFGWKLTQTLAVQIDHPSGNLEALAALATVTDPLAALVVVVRARRSPIRAIALFLQKIAAAGTGREVLVLLVGRAEGADFAPVGDEEFAHWQNFNAIHGLHLGLEKWSAA